MKLLDNIFGRGRHPNLPRGSSNATTSDLAGPTSASTSQNHRVRRGADSRDDPALDAALAASRVENHPTHHGQPPRGYPANDDDAALEAAIAASLDDQEGLEKAAKRSERGHAGSGPPERPLGGQELALLTDEPLEPPAGPAGFGGGILQVPHDRLSGSWRQSSGDPWPRRELGLRRTHTEEDEDLARRLDALWVSEDTTAGEPAARGASGVPQTGSRGRHVARGWGEEATCIVCGTSIDDGNFRQSQAGPYHNNCDPLQGCPLPPCKVCHNTLPAQDGRYHFYRHNYFNDIYCPWHHESTARCFSCMRLEPMPRLGGEGCFAELQDGRMICMPCARTAVVDSTEGAPAYHDICRFFQQELNLHVPHEMREVPVLLVDSPTLNEQTNRESSHGGGKAQGMPTTRGLTLSEVATVRHIGPGSMVFNAATSQFEFGPSSEVDLGERRAVTAILVLCGMPYASFSSILAHETMHAWMKLDPGFPSRLPPQVEEGMCQLIALLWLEHLAGIGVGDEGMGRSTSDGDAVPTEQELRGFFAHQIKTDVSEVYGDGFRKAKAAYDVLDLNTLLTHIKRHHNFPVL